MPENSASKILVCDGQAGSDVGTEPLHVKATWVDTWKIRKDGGRKVSSRSGELLPQEQRQLVPGQLAHSRCGRYAASCQTLVPLWSVDVGEV